MRDGRSLGTNSIQAAAAGLQPVTFTATAEATPDCDGDGATGLSDFLGGHPPPAAGMAWISGAAPWPAVSTCTGVRPEAVQTRKLTLLR